MTQTKHGWHIRDTTFTDEPYPRDNSRRKNCKGPKRCAECRADIHAYHGGTTTPKTKRVAPKPEGYVDHFFQ